MIFTLTIVKSGSSERPKELHGKHNSLVLHLSYYFFGVYYELSIRDIVTNKTRKILVFMVLVFQWRAYYSNNKPNWIILHRGKGYRGKEQDLMIGWEWDPLSQTDSGSLLRRGRLNGTKEPAMEHWTVSRQCA